jgi:hypothetical protein
MGILLLQIFVFADGILAILFSVLAWRLKQNVFFILGIVFTAIYLIYAIINYEFLWGLLQSGSHVFVIFNAAFIILPILFLVKSKTDKPPKSLDGIEANGAVTEEYLDSIINAPDEEVDFEDGLDLK